MSARVPQIPTAEATLRRHADVEETRRRERYERETCIQLERAENAIKGSLSMPIKFRGNLHDEAVKEIESKGWKVTNTYVARDTDGPSTQPTWEFTPA